MNRLVEFGGVLLLSICAILELPLSSRNVMTKLGYILKVHILRGYGVFMKLLDIFH